MGIKVAIGCRVNLFAEGLKKLLEPESNLEIVGVTSEPDELKEILSAEPNVMLTDSFMSKQVLSNQPPPKMRILCLSDSRGFVGEYGDLSEMVNRGFSGFLPIYADQSMLLKAIDSVNSGELWIDRKTMKDSLVHRGKEEINLTKRESEILKCLSSGYSNKEIAQKLFITEQTVKSHFNRLYKKFGVKNRLKLALLAHQQDTNHYFH